MKNFFLILVLLAGVYADVRLDQYKMAKSQYIKALGLEGYEFAGKMACFEDKLINDRPAGMEVSFFQKKILFCLKEK